MKEKIVRKVLAELPSYAWVKPIFYRRDSSPILSGLCVSKRSYQLDVYRYIQPLYDDYAFVHLSYSQEIEPRNKIKTIDQDNDDDVASGIARFLREEEKAIDALSTVTGFVNHLEGRFKYLTSDADELPGADKDRYIYAVSLLMEDRVQEAAHQLDAIIDNRDVDNLVPTASMTANDFLRELDPEAYIDARLGRQSVDVYSRANLIRGFIGVAPERVKAWLQSYAESNRMLILTSAALKRPAKGSD
jgi:hypothetical protein